MFKYLAANDSIEAVDEFGVWNCARIVSTRSEGTMSWAVWPNDYRPLGGQREDDSEFAGKNKATTNLHLR